MQKTPIPYTPTFNQDTMTLLLTVDSSAIDLDQKKKIAESLRLSPKKEFHCTIIGRATGEEILTVLEKLGDAEKAKMVDIIGALCECFDGSIEPRDTYYCITKTYSDIDTRRSLIQMVDIIGQEKLYTTLNQLLNTEFVLPVPHVTLCTTSTLKAKKMRGIGLYNQDDLKKYGHQV